MPVPEDVVYMMKHPGVYAVSGDGMTTYAFVEVTPEGEVHQLKPDARTRDGFLARDGWMPGARCYALKENPRRFVRVGMQEPEDAHSDERTAHWQDECRCIAAVLPSGGRVEEMAGDPETFLRYCELQRDTASGEGYFWVARYVQECIDELKRREGL